MGDHAGGQDADRTAIGGVASVGGDECGLGDPGNPADQAADTKIRCERVWRDSLLGAGASGFLLKDVPAEQLLEAVVAVARGEGRIDPSVTATVLRHFRRHHHQPHQSTNSQTALTSCEDEVLRLLARGMTTMEIAAELHVAAER